MRTRLTLRDMRERCRRAMRDAGIVTSACYYFKKRSKWLILDLRTLSMSNREIGELHDALVSRFNNEHTVIIDQNSGQQFAIRR
jgi:hypothetical protein